MITFLWVYATGFILTVGVGIAAFSKEKGRISKEDSRTVLTGSLLWPALWSTAFFSWLLNRFD